MTFEHSLALWEVVRRQLNKTKFWINAHTSSFFSTFSCNAFRRTQIQKFSVMQGTWKRRRCIQRTLTHYCNPPLPNSGTSVYTTVCPLRVFILNRMPCVTVSQVCPCCQLPLQMEHYNEFHPRVAIQSSRATSDCLHSVGDNGKKGTNWLRVYTESEGRFWLNAVANISNFTHSNIQYTQYTKRLFTLSTCSRHWGQLQSG